MLFEVEIEWHAFFIAQTVKVYVHYAGVINKAPTPAPRPPRLFSPSFWNVLVKTVNYRAILNLVAKTVTSINRKKNRISG